MLPFSDIQPLRNLTDETVNLTVKHKTLAFGVMCSPSAKVLCFDGWMASIASDKILCR